MRRLSGRARIALLLAPVAYGVLWAGAAARAHQGQQVFAGEARFSTSGDLSSSRFGIRANTLALIRMHPSLGVGFGEFNFAWSMSEFPARPSPFFGHTHNLPLRFAVELGLPLAALVIAFLGWACRVAARNCWHDFTTGDTGSPVRPALAVLALALMHSLLEYPL